MARRTPGFVLNQICDCLCQADDRESDAKTCAHEIRRITQPMRLPHRQQQQRRQSGQDSPASCKQDGSAAFRRKSVRHGYKLPLNCVSFRSLLLRMRIAWLVTSTVVSDNTVFMEWLDQRSVKSTGSTNLKSLSASIEMVAPLTTMIRASSESIMRRAAVSEDDAGNGTILSCTVLPTVRDPS